MMGYDHKVTCDACAVDLTYRSNSVDYRLVLKSEDKPLDPAGSPFVTDMMIYPPVPRTFYFCGLECLDAWRTREHEAAAARRAEYERTHEKVDLGDGWSTWRKKEIPQ